MIQEVGMLNAYKELTPVVYGQSAIKYLFYQVEAERMCFRMHWHDRMELILVVSGSMMLHSDEGHFEVLPGQVVVCAPRRMHGGIAGSKGVEYHTFMFDVEKFCNDTMASDKYLVPVLKSEMVFQPVIGNQQLRTVFEKLVAIVTNDAACHPLQAEACIYEMLGILHQYSLTPTGQLTKIDKEFYQILEYINTHFVEKITAREISLQFNYNPSYFCRRFKAITGLSFVKYVQALRMEYAIKLLKEGKDEIRYIAWKCGYPDVSYFSNCFKNHFGFRPSEIYGQR